MKNELMNLVYSGNGDSRAVRVVMVEGEPWFVLADVCAILGLGNPRQVATRIDADDLAHTVISNDGTPGNPNVRIVSEPGLYSVIVGARANIQTAPFKNWVTRDVLPTIRKTGSYVASSIEPALPDDPLILALQAAVENRQIALENKRDLIEVKTRQDNLEQRLDDQPLRSTEINVIHKLGQQLGKAMGNYPDAWRLFKTKFQLASYRDLPRREFENGKTFLERQINAWNDSGDQARLVKA
jgi:prophage antirepressor-like protein